MKNPTVDLRGQVVLITGTTSGLGRQTAQEVARTGATLVCVARDAKRGEALVTELRAESGNAEIGLMLCDLTSQASIRALAAEFKAKHDRLHVLVNNAGLLIPERKLTVDGIEETFALNHLAYFLLTHLLLDVLKASAPSRIVNVASDAHLWGKLDLDDPQFERRRYRAFRAYSDSKMANVAFSFELAKRLEGSGVTVNALNPGYVNSNFGNESRGWFGTGVKLTKRLAQSPKRGARTQVYLATSPEVAGVTGKYWSGMKPTWTRPQARDPEVRRRLWELSERLTGLK